MDSNLVVNAWGVDAVDTAKSGTYTITYNVSDAAGNQANPVSRVVEVRAAKLGFFESEYLDLETGVVNAVSDIPEEADDFKFAYNSNNTPHAVLFQNQSAGVEIAYLDSVSYSSVGVAAVESAVFVTDLVNKPFESCLLYTSPSPRDQRGSRMPSSA